jgi:hypothetical protein
MAAAIKLSGNRAGWLVAVARLIMEGGDKPPSRATLYRRAPKLVGPTATNDGHVTAAENGLPRADSAAGQRLFVDFWIDRLRQEGWVDGADDALRWTGPLTGDMRIKVGNTKFAILDGEESERAKDESKVADVLAGRGHVNRVRFFKKDSDEVALTSRGQPMRKDLEVHPLALTIPQMTGAEINLLRKDVQEYGIREPLVLFEGKVLDGRHRLYMASEYDLPVHLREFEGDEASARQYVFSANVVRRQLTVAQKTLAAKELFMPEAERRANEAAQQARERAGRTKGGYRTDAVANNGSGGAERGKTAAQIASEMSGGMASARSMETMKNVSREDTPDTVEKIERGEIQTAKAAAESAEAESGRPVPDLPEDRTARDLAGQVKGHAKRLRDVVSQALGDQPSRGGAKAGETLMVAKEARDILDEAIRLLS